MQDVVTLDLGRIAQDLQIRKVQVEHVVQLLEEGNTVPFIARYRRDRIGGCGEETIRQIQHRVLLQRQLAERKQTILKNLQTQGKLTDELQAAIIAAATPRRLDDLYLPFKPKKPTPASIARERGLEPLALAIWNRDPAVANLEEILPTFVNPDKQLPSPEEVQVGVHQIIAEKIAETADVRDVSRRIMWETGKLVAVKSDKLPDGQGLEYRDYFQFAEPVRHIPAHRILAINRGEKEGALRVTIDVHKDRLQRAVLEKLPLTDHPHAELIHRCALESLEQLVVPALAREIRRELTDEAEEHAVQVFTRNLRNLLLQPPVRGKRVLAIDPGFRTGCRLAVLDDAGNLLEDAVVHPHPVHSRRVKERKPPRKAEATHEPTVDGAAANDSGAAPAAMPLIEAPAAIAEAPAAPSEPVVSTLQATTLQAEPAVATADGPVDAPVHATTDVTLLPAAAAPAAAAHKRQDAKVKIEELVRKHAVTLIALGNGTASRDTEELIAEIIADTLPDLSYVIVSEGGASHYAVSAIGREELPNCDAALRSAISIGRRLQDPLSELVKIDPQNIGVGLYQHDVGPKRLKDSLEAALESCVNYVGVDLNTAGVPLLRRVAGLNPLTARALVDYRQQHGGFRSREHIKEVPGITDTAFTQAAGFLRTTGGDNPLDATWLHPESYAACRRLLEHVNGTPETLADASQHTALCERLRSLAPEDVCKALEINPAVFREIVDALVKPAHDPRDDLPAPVFRKGVLRLEDLKPGMELKGTVLNVVDFGAFVDVGLKDSGLVHISQLANRYVRSPYDVVSVGDVVTVWVLNVDAERRRVSFTMVKPGTERKPPERKEQPRRPPRQGAPRQQQATAATAGTRMASSAVATAVAVPAGRLGTPTPAGRQTIQQRRPHQGHRRPPPKPKLSEEALQGDEPLRTFAELKALYEAKKQQ